MKQNLLFAVVAIVILMVAQETSSLKSISVRGANKYASNNAFTGKEICVLKVLNLYKMHYLKYVFYKRAKMIKKLYNLERQRRKYDRLHSEEIENEDTGENTWTESRRLVRKTEIEFNKKHLRQFIKKMGDKMKIFGKVFTYKQLKRKKETLRKIRKNWVSTVARGSAFNRESTLSRDIQNLLMHQFGLARMYKRRLTHCNLNTQPSLARCEQMHGTGSCETLYSGVVHKKCPKGLQRVGCCSCAPPCPIHHFKDDNYFCTPKKNYKLDLYYTKSECQLEQKNCIKVGSKFTGVCKAGFHQVKDSLECRVDCPKGWTVENNSCLKPGIISLGTPFVWIKSDN